MSSALSMILWGREDGSTPPYLVCLGATVYVGVITNAQNDFKPHMTITNFLNYNPRDMA